MLKATGCCDWNLLEEFSIYRAEIASTLDDDCYTVHVHVGWKWSQDDEGEDDVLFEVYVPFDAERDDQFDYDRLS